MRVRESIINPMRKSTNPKGDCNCDLWDRDPEHFRKEGIPEGYCGFCDSIVGGKECGKPGHVRHHPGPHPVTACWCDEHYEVAATGCNPVAWACGLFSWGSFLGLIVLGGWLIYRWLF